MEGKRRDEEEMQDSLVVEVGITGVQLGFNPLSQFVPYLELYSQLQLSLSSYPIAFCVPKPT